MNVSVSSVEIVLLDFFKEIEDNLSEIFDSPTLKALCEPIIDLTLIFSDIENSEQVNDFITTIHLPQEETDGLQRFFKETFQTSFSYGYKDKEFVFIQLEETSPLLK